MQANMLNVSQFLPQPKTITKVHQGLLPLHKSSFITGHGSSVRLLQSGPRRTIALRGNWKSSSIQVISNKANANDEIIIKRSDFPEDFFFGTASSAYQYEGAIKEGGKGVSNWDQFTHRHPDRIKDGKNGDIALDSYNRYKEHVDLMKDLNVNSYRFSIAWTRILPTGKLSGGVSEEGVQYYSNLIDELLSKGIQPFVTLFHWDVPQALQDEYGGFLNPQIIKDYTDYVNVCFERFGGRVKYWITLNEPFVFTTLGYVHGAFPPSSLEDLGTTPYTVAHNLLRAHAEAVDLYRKDYQVSHGGKIGITLNSERMIPLTNKQADMEAATRASDFTFGWFMDAVHFGDYPETMKHLVRDRLPNFSDEESRKLKGSYDFLGLNYYTASYVTHAPSSHIGSYLTDGCYRTYHHLEGVPIGEPTGSEWLFVYPKGIHDSLLEVKEKYNNPVVYITENGISEHSTSTKDESINDVQRVKALKDHLTYLKNALDAGVDVKGYFLWSLLDNFEWNVGYTVRFGIYYVDFNDDLKIDPKDSAIWYKKFLNA